VNSSRRFESNVLAVVTDRGAGVYAKIVEGVISTHKKLTGISRWYNIEKDQYDPSKQHKHEQQPKKQ
jgi:hypothetical protein